MPTTITIPSMGDAVLITRAKDTDKGKIARVVDMSLTNNVWLYALMLEDGTEIAFYTPGDLELPVGTCPACGEPVFNSLEEDGPVWICPRDLSPENGYWMPSDVTEEQQEEDQVFSLCYEDHGGVCDDHMPLHSACYDKGEY